MTSAKEDKVASFYYQEHFQFYFTEEANRKRDSLDLQCPPQANAMKA
jgi:hypothetical protein